MFFCGIYYGIQEPGLVKEGDPVLIIIPNPQWVNQHGQNAYNLVMNAFATVNIRHANQHRDKNSFCIFHFRDMEEIYSVRDTIETLYPNAFCIPPSYNAYLPGAQLTPIGTAWCLYKTGGMLKLILQDMRFFNIQ
nr:11918_t:CDS:2 [Entrophospora candida]